jgi:uncharacterized membrane protein HdeD (DUF308 family)
MFKSASTSLILIGVLALIIGIIAIAWPGITILALVIMFAIYAFMDAGLQTMRAFSSRSAGPVLGHLLLALVGLYALIYGFSQISAGIQLRQVGAGADPMAEVRS